MGKICTFFGHRYCRLTATEENRLETLIEDLITNHNVDTFWVSRYGQFERLTNSYVHTLKEKYPHIKIILTLAYMPKEKTYDIEQDLKSYDGTYLPEGAEIGVQRFAISRRNRLLAEQTDYIICYIQKDYGGAWAAVHYANLRHKPIFNLYQTDKPLY